MKHYACGEGDAVDGTCCDCGDVATEDSVETPCPKREDKTHCVHWEEGAPE